MSKKISKGSEQVFLGGSCDPTTWRRDVAIPVLEAAGVSYYNPQVAEWRDELVALEAAAKEKCPILLFVIDNVTRAIASILEATEYIASGRQVVLAITGDMPDGIVIAGQTITGRELKDLNRARAYLRDVAKRNDTPVFNNVEDAVEEVINRS